ncbi:MAG TPA: prolyl oligopeptidase family serine peptidase [Thermoanaerobaculia bacterium]|nr:prolyl oligopeptidase family serine peptidase [Thermoanaerobaculia bacterium]
MKRLLALLLLATGALAQEYKMPPAEIAALADAPLTPVPFVSPDDKWVLLAESPSLLTIADLAQTELKLAGLRFNPQTGDQTRAPYYRTIRLQSLAGGEPRTIAGLPASARIRLVSWSPDSSRIAFIAGSDEGVALWVVDVATLAAKRVGSYRLNATHPSKPFQWLSDSRTLLVRLRAANGTPPAAAAVPRGPVVQESIGRRATTRTYQDLLKNPADADVFEHHMQSQLAWADLDGNTTLAGISGAVGAFQASPDGRYLIAEVVHRPFSFVVPEGRFPRRVEIWSRDGKMLKQIADLPLAEEVPIDFSATRTGPRDFGWRGDKPATAFWVEAQDKGDPRVQADVRDRLYTLDAPFTETPKVLASLALRFDGIDWASDDLALVWESWWKTRQTRTWRIRPSNAAAAPQLLFDRSFEDRYADPGKPETRRNQWGADVLLTANNGRTLFLMGEGASPEGDRPFVDELDLASGKKTRLWRSEGAFYEVPYEILDERGQRLLTRRESVSEQPNFYVRDLKTKKATQLTSFPHPSPQLAAAKKELIRYQRKDGVPLTGTLYLPPGYDPKKDGPLPVLMWAYPQEFKSAAAASQVQDSPHRFIRAGWGTPLFWLVRGYAILDDPAIPIIGEGEKEPNDTYIEQLVAGAQAAVDELVRRGVGDRDRMAVGGHSYGAFMTANLLAHSDLYRAGIARSGAYNRTLTPFSFQAEERTFWEATETYMKMSPFTHANKINEPILLIHGIDDNNTGTFPIQSERLYQAISGLGGTARLVMLPSESHGYRARESVMHMLWEMDQWLEKHVKNAAPR